MIKTFALDHSLGSRKREAATLAKEAGLARKYVLAQGVDILVACIEELSESTANRAKDVGARIVSVDFLSDSLELQRKNCEVEVADQVALAGDNNILDSESPADDWEQLFVVGQDEYVEPVSPVTQVPPVVYMVDPPVDPLVQHAEVAVEESPVKEEPLELFECVLPSDPTSSDASVLSEEEHITDVATSTPDELDKREEDTRERGAAKGFFVDYSTGKSVARESREELTVFEQVFGVPSGHIVKESSWADQVRDWAEVDARAQREARKRAREERRQRRQQQKEANAERQQARRTRAKLEVQRAKDAGLAVRAAKRDASRAAFRATILQKRDKEHAARREKRKAARLFEKKKRKAAEKKLYYEQHKEEWAAKVLEYQALAAIKAERVAHREACKVFIGGIDLGDLLEEKGPKADTKLALELRKQRLLESVAKFGAVKQILEYWEKHHIFVIYKRVEDAASALETLCDPEKRKQFCAEMAVGLAQHIALKSNQFYARWPRSSPHANKSGAAVKTHVENEATLAKVARHAEAAAKDTDMTRVTCYKCLKEGHYAYTCNQKRKPKIKK